MVWQCWNIGVLPTDWRRACIVNLYKGKGDKCECSNSRGISLLSVVGKLFGRVLVKRVRAGTECAIGEEQCGFRQELGPSVCCKAGVSKVSRKLERCILGFCGFWACMDVFWAFIG